LRFSTGDLFLINKKEWNCFSGFDHCV